ncbi:tyrosine-type recombinase/integrase [Thermodesulfobacteriota bacterium]
MLRRHIDQFLDYCWLAEFSIKSIETLTTGLNKFQIFLKINKIRSVKKVSYQDLIEFVADFGSPSIHVTKSRVWALRQFYHFLTLHRIVPKNIATGLSYLKIEKTVPQFLTTDEYKMLIRFFCLRADSFIGFRNLVVILLLGTLGLRTSTLISLDFQDVDIKYGLIRIKEKGRRNRTMVLPHGLCKIINDYLKQHPYKKEPLFCQSAKIAFFGTASNNGCLGADLSKTGREFIKDISFIEMLQ